MFIIDHGPDNYAEGFELKDITFYRAAWEHPAEASAGVWIVKLVFRNGFQDALRFTQKDYERFVLGMKKLNFEVVEEGEGAGT